MERILDSDYGEQPRQDRLQGLPAMAGVRDNSPRQAAEPKDPLEDQHPKNAPLFESEELPGVEQQPDWAPVDKSRTPNFGDHSIIPRPTQRYSGESE